MTAAGPSEDVNQGGAIARSAGTGRKAQLAAVGGLLAALGSASCCVVPFVLFTLGVGGAWIGNLTALAPYQPYLFAVTLVFLGAGFVMVYRRPKPAACPDATGCRRPAADRLVKTGLWTATGLVALALAWPYIAPVLLDL